MRAVAGEPDVAAGAPHLGTFPFGWPADDHSGEVTSRGARQHGPVHLAGNVFHVGGVDRCRFDADHRFLGCGVRVGQIRDVQDIGVTKLVEA